MKRTTYIVNYYCPWTVIVYICQRLAAVIYQYRIANMELMLNHFKASSL